MSIQREGSGRRIVLFVEGDSERGDGGRQSLAGFLKRWLDQQIPAGKRVGIDAVNLGGIDKYLDDVGDLANRYLGEQRAHFAVGVVDLCGLPESRIQLAGINSISQRVAKARAEILTRISMPQRNRFRQHFAVHEFEAWLLAYPELWPQNIRASITKRPPEEINSVHPPAKLLGQLLGRQFKKTVEARRILAKGDPSQAIQKCPYLKMLAEDLLKLAKLLQ